LQHCAPVLGIGVVAKVRAFIDKPVAVRIHHDAERIAVPVTGAVLAVDVAVVAGIALPRHRMTARPLAIGLRADLERHPDAVAGVVARAAYLRHVPAWAKIARAPFAVGFETPAGEHHGARTDGFFASVDQRANALGAAFAAHDRLRARAITDRDAMLRSRLV